MIGKGSILDGLYIFQNTFNKLCSTLFPSSINLVDNMHMHTSKFSCKTCSVCLLAKQKRLPFTCHNHFSDACFDLIHCDIWGPFHTPTYGNHRFFLSIVDDHSRFTWIFLLQSKQQASVCINFFFQFVKTQFQKSIKCLRSDNAKEFFC